MFLVIVLCIMNLLCKGMAKKRIAQYLKMSVLVSYVGKHIKSSHFACIRMSIRWKHLAYSEHVIRIHLMCQYTN